MERLETIIVVALICMFLAVYTNTAWGGDSQIWAEVGAGYNTSFFQDTERYQWENAGSPAFFGRLSYEYYPVDRLAFVVQYTHVSQWMAGPPINDKGESSLDHFGISVRWRLDRGN